MWHEYLTPPIIIAFLSIFGGGSGIFWYILNKPKTNADINKINSEVSVTYAEEWRKLFEQNKAEIGILRGEMKGLHDENVEMKRTYESQIKDFKSQLIEKDRIHALIIMEKDEQIKELGKRIDKLSDRLKKYEKLDEKVEVAKEDIVLKVSESLDNIKKT